MFNCMHTSHAFRTTVGSLQCSQILPKCSVNCMCIPRIQYYSGFPLVFQDTPECLISCMLAIYSSNYNYVEAEFERYLQATTGDISNLLKNLYLAQLYYQSSIPSALSRATLHISSAQCSLHVAKAYTIMQQRLAMYLALSDLNPMLLYTRSLSK